MTDNYSLEYEENVIDYFAAKAADYDCVDEQLYWRLSDQILWEVLKKDVAAPLRPDFRFLDAGGGTGRWTCRLLKEFPQARGLIYDLSKDMTTQARVSAERLGVSDRLDIMSGRLEEVSGAVEGPFDLIFSFHNVLGFVQDPAGVIRQLGTLLAEGGTIASMVPSSYHAAFFNIGLGLIEEARNCLGPKMGRFTDTMPAMHLFTPTSIAEIHRTGGFEVERVTGFPCLIYPGYQETQLHGATASLQDMLASKEKFNAIFEMEIEAMKDDAIAARGNNILLIGRKG